MRSAREHLFYAGVLVLTTRAERCYPHGISRRAPLNFDNCRGNKKIAAVLTYSVKRERDIRMYRPDHWRRQLWGNGARAPLDLKLVNFGRSLDHITDSDDSCGFLSSRAFSGHLDMVSILTRAYTRIALSLVFAYCMLILS